MVGTSYDVVQIVDVVFLHDAGQILDDAAAGEGVDKVGSADLNSRCAGEHQFDDVLGAHHAAETDDGNAHRFVHLPDHAHRKREECGAGHAARAVGKKRLSRFEIEPHAHHGVDEADAVRACVLAGLGNVRNACDVGRELDDDGFFDRVLHRARDRCGSLRVSAEAHAAAVDVGAGDVHLEPANLRTGVELLADLDVFIERKAADICHDGLAENARELGKLLGDNRVHTGVLKTHGVKHTALHLSDARLGIAKARIARRSLKGERAEAIDIVEFCELVAVAEGTARGNNGVIERKRAERDVCFYHLISSLLNTGPSRQTRLGPFTVSIVQPMHAPKPQPMRASRLI